MDYARVMSRFTVDELAAATGLPTSTLRLYRHRGLLDPPQREGRRAYYEQRHVAQLEMIGRLKERGYSLAAIREMVELYRNGGSLGSILGGELAGGTLLELSSLLEALFPGGQIDPAVMSRAADLGLVRVGEDGVELRHRRDLEHGLALSELGVPVSVVLDEFEHLQQVTAGLVERYADVFETHVLPRSEAPAADLDRLINLVRSVMESTLDQALRLETNRRLTGEPQD